jgi:hypothetical protein
MYAMKIHIIVNLMKLVRHQKYKCILYKFIKNINVFYINFIKHKPVWLKTRPNEHSLQKGGSNNFFLLLPSQKKCHSRNFKTYYYRGEMTSIAPVYLSYLVLINCCMLTCIYKCQIRQNVIFFDKFWIVKRRSFGVYVFCHNCGSAPH